MRIIKTFESFHEAGDEMMQPSLIKIGSMNQPDDKMDHETHNEAENYMFFGNLETIQRLTDIMLKMDPTTVDEVLRNGHSWATDHIATSKDDIEEVANFLINEMSKVAESSTDEPEGASGMTESNYTCNECGSVYEATLIKEGDACKCGGTLVKGS